VLRAIGLAFALLALTAHAQNPARPSEVVYLHGSAIAPHRVITRDELAQQPAEAIGEFTQSRGAPGAESRSTVRGVRLVRLIERMGLTPAARANWKNLLVTVTATDGYTAQFTWAELSNTPAGEGVLLLFERDGQPLDAREGRIALIATGDLRLGARHVRNVLRIEVRALDN
jgi:hypothetical protein